MEECILSWYANICPVKTGDQLIAHNSLQKGLTSGLLSPKRRSPDGFVPSSVDVIPLGTGCVKLKQPAPFWHPHETTVPSPPPLLSRRAAVSSKVLFCYFLLLSRTRNTEHPLNRKYQNWYPFQRTWRASLLGF